MRSLARPVLVNFCGGIDEVDPRELRLVFREVFSQFHCGGGLKGMESFAGHCPVSIDGTELPGSGSASAAAAGAGILFIIRAKSNDRKILQAQLEIDGEIREFRDEDGTAHEFRRPAVRSRTTATATSWPTPRNTGSACRSGVSGRPREFRTEPEKTTRCGWTAEFKIEPALPAPPMRAGRARWKVENEPSAR